VPLLDVDATQPQPAAVTVALQPAIRNCVRTYRGVTVADESRPFDSAHRAYRRWASTDRAMQPLYRVPVTQSTRPAQPDRPDRPERTDRLERIGHGYARSEQGSGPEEWQPRVQPLSPAQERRRGQGLKASAGITVAIAVTVVTAAFLWRAVQGLPQQMAGPARGNPPAGMIQRPSAAANGAPPVDGVGVSAATRTVSPATSPTAGQPRTVVIVPQAAPTDSPRLEPSVTPASTAAPAVRTPQQASPPVAAAPEISSNQRIHTVERGDTLFSIARRNGTTVDVLVQMNGLDSRGAILSVGRRLILP